MDYDVWKTGWYDAEPEIDHEDCYSHNHEENREAIKELIDALYADDELNIEFIQETMTLISIAISQWALKTGNNHEE